MIATCMNRKNTIAKGNRNKYKTKKYLEAQGYWVEYSERNQVVRFGKRAVFVKKDLFFSDIIAVRNDEILFVQVKSNKHGIQDAVSKFESVKNKFPQNSYLVVLSWQDRVKEPLIIKINPKQ